MAGEWEETTLGAEVDLLTGFPFKSERYTDSPDSIPLVRGDNIVQGAMRWDGVKRWPLSERGEHELYELREGDVVLAMDRPWIEAGLKYAAISKHDLPCLLVQRTARLRGGPKLDTRFLRYLIGSREFTQHIHAITTGTAVPHISGRQIKDFTFALPPLAEQKAIAAVLGALDDKIELNRRMNATLEAMARALFQSWFVDFDPVRAKLDARPPAGLDPATAALFPNSFEHAEREVLPTGWTHSPLPNVTTFKEGPGILAKDFHEMGVPLIRLAGLDNGVSLLDGCNFLDPEMVKQKWSHFRLEKGDVLLSTSASLGRVAEVEDEAVGAIPYTGLIAFRARANRSYQRYIRHYLTSPHFQRQVEAMGVGSVLRHFGPTHLKSMSILEPALAIQRAFSDLVAPLDQQVARNLSESRTLATLRDTLLPKLLSGELSVNH